MPLVSGESELDLAHPIHLSKACVNVSTVVLLVVELGDLNYCRP